MQSSQCFTVPNCCSSRERQDYSSARTTGSCECMLCDLHFSPGAAEEQVTRADGHLMSSLSSNRLPVESSALTHKTPLAIRFYAFNWFYWIANWKCRIILIKMGLIILRWMVNELQVLKFRSWRPLEPFSQWRTMVHKVNTDHWTVTLIQKFWFEFKIH